MLKLAGRSWSAASRKPICNFVISIFDWKNDVVICGCTVGVRLLEHGGYGVGRKTVEQSSLITVSEMQFGFCPIKGTSKVMIGRGITKGRLFIGKVYKW